MTDYSQCFLTGDTTTSSLLIFIKFCFHRNFTEPQITQMYPIFTIQLHFTQEVVGEPPFLLHHICLHIKKRF